MVKIIGLLLAVIGCTGIGILKSTDFRERKRLLIEFKELTLHISTEISYFKQPLPQIFERLAGERQDKETGFLLRNCLTSYMTANCDIGEIWKQAVDIVYESLPVTSSDRNTMKKCGEFLGQSDFKGQKEHFELLNLQLDRQIQEAEDLIGTKGKMYSRLGLSAGCMIAVILI